MPSLLDQFRFWRRSLDQRTVSWWSHLPCNSRIVSDGVARLRAIPNRIDRSQWKNHASVEFAWIEFCHQSQFFSIQMANIVSQPQACVLMSTSGSVEKLSEPLGGYYTTTPQMLGDGNVYFWRNDKIWQWDLVQSIKQTVETSFGSSAFGSSIKFSESKLGFCIQNGTGDKKRCQMISLEV